MTTPVHYSPFLFSPTFAQVEVLEGTALNLYHLFPGERADRLFAYPKLGIYGKSEQECLRMVELFESLKKRGGFGETLFNTMKQHLEQGQLILMGVPGSTLDTDEVKGVKGVYIQLEKAFQLRGKNVDRVLALPLGCPSSWQQLNFYEEAAHFYIESLKSDRLSACPLDGLPRKLQEEFVSIYNEANVSFHCNPHPQGTAAWRRHNFLYKKIFYEPLNPRLYPPEQHPTEAAAKLLKFELFSPGFLETRFPKLRRSLDTVLHEARQLPPRIHQVCSKVVSLCPNQVKSLCGSVLKHPLANLPVNIYLESKNKPLDEAMVDGSATWAIGCATTAASIYMGGLPATLLLTGGSIAADLLPDIKKMADQIPSPHEVQEFYREFGFDIPLGFLEINQAFVKSEYEFLGALQDSLKMLNPLTIWDGIKKELNLTPLEKNKFSYAVDGAKLLESISFEEKDDPHFDREIEKVEPAVEHVEKKVDDEQEKRVDYWPALLQAARGLISLMEQNVLDREKLHEVKRHGRETERRIVEMLNELDFPRYKTPKAYFDSLRETIASYKKAATRYREEIKSVTDREQTTRGLLVNNQKISKECAEYFQKAIKEKQKVGQKIGAFFTFAKLAGEFLLGEEGSRKAAAVSEVGSGINRYFTDKTVARLMRASQACQNSIGEAASLNHRVAVDVAKEKEHTQEQYQEARLFHRTQAHEYFSPEEQLQMLREDAQLLNEMIEENRKEIEKSQNKKGEAEKAWVSRLSRNRRKRWKQKAENAALQAAVNHADHTTGLLQCKNEALEEERNKTEQAELRIERLKPFHAIGHELVYGTMQDQTPLEKGEVRCIEEALAAGVRNIQLYDETRAPVNQAVEATFRQAYFLSNLWQGSRASLYVALTSQLWQAYRVFEETTKVHIKNLDAFRKINWVASDGKTEVPITWINIFKHAAKGSLSPEAMTHLTVLFFSNITIWMKAICIAHHIYSSAKSLQETKNGEEFSLEDTLKEVHRELLSNRQVNLDLHDKLSHLSQHLFDILERNFDEIKQKIDLSDFRGYKERILQAELKIGRTNDLKKIESHLQSLTSELYSGGDVTSDQSRFYPCVSDLSLLERNPEYFSAFLYNALQPHCQWEIPNGYLLEAVARTLLTGPTTNHMAAQLVQHIEKMEAFIHHLPAMLQELVQKRNALSAALKAEMPSMQKEIRSAKILQAAWEMFKPFQDRALSEDFVGSKRFYLNKIAAERLLHSMEKIDWVYAYERSRGFWQSFGLPLSQGEVFQLERLAHSTYDVARLSLKELSFKKEQSSFCYYQFYLNTHTRSLITFGEPPFFSFQNLRPFCQVNLHFASTQRVEVSVDLREKVITPLDLKNIPAPGYRQANDDEYDRELKAFITSCYMWLQTPAKEGDRHQVVPSVYGSQVPLAFPRVMLKEIMARVLPEMPFIEATKTGYLLPFYRFEMEEGKLYLDFCFINQEGKSFNYCSQAIAQVDTKKLLAYQRDLNAAPIQHQNLTEFLLMWFYGGQKGFGIPNHNSHLTCGGLYAPQESDGPGLYQLWEQNPDAYLDETKIKPLPVHQLGQNYLEVWLSLKREKTPLPQEKSFKDTAFIVLAMIKHLSGLEEPLLFSHLKKVTGVEMVREEDELLVGLDDQESITLVKEEVSQFLALLSQKPSLIMEKLAAHKRALKSRNFF